MWRSGAAQAAIFQIRLHFVSGEKKVGYESRAITRAVSDVFSFHATDPGVFYASYRVLKVRFSSIERKESFKIFLVFFPENLLNDSFFQEYFKSFVLTSGENEIFFCVAKINFHFSEDNSGFLDSVMEGNYLTNRIFVLLEIKMFIVRLELKL